MPGRDGRRLASGTRRVWWLARPGRLAAIFISVAFLIVLAYLAFGLIQVRTSLVNAESQAVSLKSHVLRGDVEAANAALGDLQRSTADARQRSDGLLWSVGEKVPFVGDDLEAVRTISVVLDRIARQGLPPVLESGVNADTFRFDRGRIDLSAMGALAPQLSTTDKVVSGGLRELEAIEEDGLFDPLRRPVVRLRGELGGVQRAASAGATALHLLPPMMGGDEPRKYALVVQNNAEVRSTGGIPGAFAIVKAKNGKLTLGRQGSAADFGYFDPPAMKITTSERSLYSELMASFWADTNFTPDFPRTATIMRRMLLKRFGQRVDGVISVDPIALSYVLRGTGPVKLTDGTALDSGNAVKTLLSDVYAKYDKRPLVQDAFFADAARSIFKAVSSGQGDPRQVIKELMQASDENRILINSTHDEEQEVLGASRIGGALIRTATRSPRVGLYLNDSTTTKLEYYLSRTSQMSSQRCSESGVQTLALTTVLASDVPRNISRLPRSVLGPGTGEKRGWMRMNLRYYAPLGGTISDLRVNDEKQTVARGRDGDLEVAILPILLAPGQKVTVSAELESGKNQRGDAIFSTTPGIERTPNNVSVQSTCE